MLHEEVVMLREESAKVEEYFKCQSEMWNDEKVRLMEEIRKLRDTLDVCALDYEEATQMRKEELEAIELH